MKFGLSDDQYKFIDQNVVKPLAALGARVYVYGSRARGDFQKFSDLDLMVESPRKAELPLESIQEKLQKSNFPLKVDLVHFADFAEAYKSQYEHDKTPWSVLNQTAR